MASQCCTIEVYYTSGMRTVNDGILFFCSVHIDALSFRGQHETLTDNSV